MPKPPKAFKNFSKSELAVFKRLNSPKKVQDFLDKLPINFEEHGDTCYSPRELLKHKKSHCSEGAIFAAAVFWYHGAKPLLMDLKAPGDDFDHVVTLFKVNGYWGAVSKTNHAVLRYREPIYKTLRELALSYFHEYITDSGKKTLRSFSAAFDLSKIKNHDWLTTDKQLWKIIEDLDVSKHHLIVSATQARGLRKADKIEIQAGKIIEWRRPKKSTKK